MFVLLYQIYQKLTLLRLSQNGYIPHLAYEGDVNYHAAIAHRLDSLSRPHVGETTMSKAVRAGSINSWRLTRCSVLKLKFAAQTLCAQ